MKTNKKKIGVAVFAGILAIAIIIFSLVVIGWNQSADFHLFLGERYMDELNYEQALAEFERALDIDPKNDRIYELMADVYEEMGKPDKAVEILASGYQRTSAPTLVEKAEDDYDLDIKDAFNTVGEDIIVRPSGMDLCFVIDTTGSMGDAITDARENMKSIIEKVAEKTDDYRIAIVDYRDFAERTGDWADYPAKVQLDFTSDRDAIQEGINQLTLGYGGDGAETVYSGLMQAAALDWRETAQHVIIWIGDAQPLDPEPISGYTYDDVMEALRLGKASVDLEKYIYESYDDYSIRATELTGYADTYEVTELSYGSVASETEEDSDDEDDEEPSAYFNISTYGIVTNPYDDDLNSAFESICDSTGGSVSSTYDTTVSEEIYEIIEQVEVIPVSTDATVNFGFEHEDSEIEVYSGQKLIKEIELNSSGKATVRDMPFGTYLWKDITTGAYGYMTVTTESTKAFIDVAKEPGAMTTLALELIIGFAISAFLMLLVGILVIVSRIKKVKKADLKKVEI